MARTKQKKQKKSARGSLPSPIANRRRRRRKTPRHRNATAASQQQVAKRKKKYCDMCWIKDKPSEGLHLQICRKCRVPSHKECYGNALSTDPEGGFVCFACRAVGTTVKVRKRDARTGKRLKFTVNTRPSECCFCGVDDGDEWPHAMHAVYDCHGEKAWQLLLPPSEGKPARLAWAHTFCCQVIASHPRTGGVYGCNRKGEYDGTDEDEDSGSGSDQDSDSDSEFFYGEEGDTDSVNSYIQSGKAAEDDEAITHFVICLRRNEDEKVTSSIKSIWKQQNDTHVCTICGKSDSARGIFRIPLQCSANEKQVEHSDFEGTHGDLGDETCTASMHAGCAFWGRNDAGELPACRGGYFYPGPEKGKVKNIVTNMFCKAHAEDLAMAGSFRTGATELRYPKHLPVASLPKRASPVSSASGRR